MRGVNNSVDTVNAAASAIITAESRVQQVTVPRRRWGAWLSVYWCFGSQKHTKHINHAALVPEPTSSSASEAPTSHNLNHPQTLTLPFIAPPSSPASFLNSEPPSSAQSPGGFLSLSTLSANAYSPTGPSSIFANGPYANETQLVSPPVFSTFTTEPNTATNTAPFTPPPESVQITTPSSPEVPFARLLSSSFESNCKKGDPIAVRTYQWYQGSPIGHHISPSSVCSGTSSPFTDVEINSSRRHSSILDGQISAIIPKDDEPAVDHRVSFELTAEEVARCMEKKVVGKRDAAVGEEQAKGDANCVDEGETRTDESGEKIESSGELVASKEFKFSNSDGVGTVEPSVGSEWWVNEKVISAETAAAAPPPKNWAFFPMVQSGVS